MCEISYLPILGFSELHLGVYCPLGLWYAGIRKSSAVQQQLLTEKSNVQKSPWPMATVTSFSTGTKALQTSMSGIHKTKKQLKIISL